MFNAEKISEFFKGVHDKIYGNKTSFNNVFAGGNVGTAALALAIDGIAETSKDFVALEREKFEWTKKIAEDYKSMAQASTGLHPANGPTAPEDKGEQCTNCGSTNTVRIIKGVPLTVHLCHDCDREFQIGIVDKPKKRIIIALAGMIGSGKGTVAKYLETNHGAKVLRFSDTIREALKVIHQEETRDNMQRISTALREAIGNDLLGNAMYFKVNECNAEIIVVDGVRRSEDIEYLKDIEGFTLVYVKADVHDRYKRVIGRGENSGDNEKTLDVFMDDDLSESESRIRALEDSANKIIDNRMTLERLYIQIDKLIHSLKNV